jgi:hypothetical protein
MEQSDKARKKEGALKKVKKKIRDIEERRIECLAVTEAEKRKHGGGEERCMLQVDRHDNGEDREGEEGEKEEKHWYILPKLWVRHSLIRGTILGRASTQHSKKPLSR